MPPAMLNHAPPRNPKALPPAISPFPTRRFSVDEYHKMIEIGVLGKYDKCELIHGWIVPKMPQYPPHANTIRLLLRWFAIHLPAEMLLQSQLPVTTDDSEPEPDFAVVLGGPTEYSKSHPVPLDTLLVIEVSESSLAYDRGTKLELYAGSKVPQYWIVNLIEKQIEVYTLPRGGKKPQYKNRVDYKVEDSIPVVLAKTAIGSIPVRDILP